MSSTTHLHAEVSPISSLIHEAHLIMEAADTHGLPPAVWVSVGSGRIEIQIPHSDRDAFVAWARWIGAEPEWPTTDTNAYATGKVNGLTVMAYAGGLYVEPMAVQS